MAQANPFGERSRLGTTAQIHDPIVTLIVAMRNEARSIDACLTSILDQDYPVDRLEILVADGASDDGSREIASGRLRGRPMAEVFDNPERTQAAGWNLGIDRARGEVIGIVSGHATLAPDYVRAGVRALDRTGATMVGGPVHAVATTTVGRAIAAAMSTPFGVGSASFRYAEREVEVDTVFMGICLSTTYRRFKFDSRMVRNQDDELSYRLLDAGGRIVCDPLIRSTYRSRSSIRSLARQYFDYGLWKVDVLVRHPKQARLRQFVPPLFVTLILGAGALSPVSESARFVVATAIATYLIVVLGVSVWVSRRDPVLGPLLPVAFATLHLSYGLGFLVGILRAVRGRVAALARSRPIRRAEPADHQPSTLGADEPPAR